MAFHKASIRLAGLYLVIMMAISLFFSLNVYQLSVQEFDRGLRRPGGNPGIGSPLERLLPDDLRQQIDDEREAQYEEAKQRVITRLLLINAVILVGAGALSYYLARRTLRPIEEAHEVQSRFTADASHELRTPIAAMQTEIEVALMNPHLTLDQTKRQLRSNLEELDKLTRLSEGLLRLARMENGDLLKDKVNVLTILQRAVDRVLSAAEAKRILISLPKGADAVVVGDEDSLVEALVTVLDNAIKYSNEKTKVVVTITKERRHVVLHITDQGIGIKATELPHIFDRFYRADTARSKQSVHGYGLGLAIAKNIIDAHNGTISAVSKRGKGTTFTVILPL
jgi:signal transduction histidine kinase